MDLHMPVLNGEQAARRMREMETSGMLDMTGTKIIALSAINED
jgi:CheY-like chemotaxis protein